MKAASDRRLRSGRQLWDGLEEDSVTRLTTGKEVPFLLERGRAGGRGSSPAFQVPSEPGWGRDRAEPLASITF